MMGAGPWPTVRAVALWRRTKVMASRAFPIASRTQSLRVTTRGSSCSCQEEAEDEEKEEGETGGKEEEKNSVTLLSFNLSCSD